MQKPTRANVRLDTDVFDYFQSLNESDRIRLQRAQGHNLNKGRIISEAVRETGRFQDWANDRFAEMIGELK